jgi:cell division protein FtsI (penicillin-binding protein 3)
MKPFTISHALDIGLVTPSTVFDTMPFRVGPKVIHDVHTSSQLTVADILKKSSDVGTVKIGFKFTPKQIWDFDTAVGFGQKVGTGFPGEARGILLPWQRWYPIDQASISYGYAISVSLLQMARGYTLFTNNGCILPVSFYKDENGAMPQCKQIISPKTATTMRDILSTVTNDGGTGVLAGLDNYTSAGKTGTAHKATNHGYMANSYVGSFIGFAPAFNPKIIVAVMIDDPHGEYYGGVVAAPVFAKIAEPALHILGVKPDKAPEPDKKKKVYL